MTTATGGTQPLVGGLVYPECPRWRDGHLWFSDQHAGVVHRTTSGGDCRPVLEVDDEPAGLGWTADGTLVVVAMQTRRVLHVRDGRTEVFADLAAVHPGLSNELLVHPGGWSYVGNIGFDFYAGEGPRTTVLALVADDGSVSVAADDLLVPNGMVLTPDGSRLVVAESFAHRLTAFDVGTDGSLTGRRVFADLGVAVPDGICLDAEGAVWFASIGAHEVVRVTEGGTVTDRISTGDREAVACTLGGADLRTLFVCTSRSFDPGRTRAERAGAIESAPVKVPGSGSP